MPRIEFHPEMIFRGELPAKEANPAFCTAVGGAFLLLNGGIVIQQHTRPRTARAVGGLCSQIAVQVRAREVRRRFLGAGTPYRPATVNFYSE